MNILRDVLVLQGWRISINETKWTLLVVALCAFFMTFFHSSSNAAVASGVSIAEGERSSAHAHVSQRLPDSSVPDRVARGKLNIQSLYSFISSSTLEKTRTLRAFRVTRRICPTDTLCRETRLHALAFTFEELGEELS